MARPTKAKAIERLRRALDVIPELKPLRHDSQEFQKWYRDTRVVIAYTFGDKSHHIREFGSIKYATDIDPVAIALFGKDRTRTPSSISQEAYVKGLESAVALLGSMLEEIEEYWEDPTQAALLLEKLKKDEEPRKYESQTPTSSAAQESELPNTNEVFVIHGRDNEAKETVARFLEKLDLTPVILHEQPNQGRTIIEKFEQHAQVGFAVALLTPDDVGARKGDEKRLKPRARQNVIFEFGYLIGRLGRNRVCALKGEVEIPSDYDGVVYTSLDDSGGWKMKLITELKDAGFKIDANKAL